MAVSVLNLKQDVWKTIGFEHWMKDHNQIAPPQSCVKKMMNWSNYDRWQREQTMLFIPEWSCTTVVQLHYGINKLCSNVCLMFWVCVWFQWENGVISLFASSGFRNYLHTKKHFASQHNTNQLTKLKICILYCETILISIRDLMQSGYHGYGLLSFYTFIKFFS